jgi:hypothetical protein
VAGRDADPVADVAHLVAAGAPGGAGGVDHEGMEGRGCQMIEIIGVVLWYLGAIPCVKLLLPDNCGLTRSDLLLARLTVWVLSPVTLPILAVAVLVFDRGEE